MSSTLTRIKNIFINIVMFSLLLTSLGVMSAYALEKKTIDVKYETDTPGVNHSNGKLSFYFQNIEIKALLQLLAKTAKANFIISDAVTGTTTLNLKDVTWNEALNIILKSHGLAKREFDNAIYVSTLDDIISVETKELKSGLEIANLAPLQSRMINLKYTDATTLSDLLKGDRGSLLTPRGEVAIDKRTNSIIIRDISSNLNDVVTAVNKLDVPAKQVSIEARIVSIDTRFEEQLGVRFGVSNTTSLSGTLSGANQLAQGTRIAEVTPLANRLNFNVPAAALSGGATPASIGLALARLGPILLDLELSALEEEGHTQIISRPRVVTSNQEKAVIQTGEEIPYQQATSSGATSIEFKKAVLSLEIIPQITPNNKILLRLKATQDARGPSLVVTAVTTDGVTTPTTFGPPTIITQAVESYVLLNDNETVVVGGVYKIEKSKTFDRVPFLSSLPVVGHFFKHDGMSDKKSELLIFITPKIIKSQLELLNKKDIFKD